ncbi:hypothetical protein KUCAC02_003023 [Chaenocephalus aceratus]|uniref:Uncharacterized protein n=1 Tax=Chaenocephalus aceratus TaxID=36190 RepID=A0ACB9WKB4_CHAAC|nr:hypothetical protein KUCAC02_003023 [Chaenocephalus aceratus]
MAASAKGLELSKAEYLKRYLSADEDGKKSKGKPKKKRRPVSDKSWKPSEPAIDGKLLELTKMKTQKKSKEKIINSKSQRHQAGVAMTLRTYPLKEEVAMTPQTCPLKEEVIMTPQTCPLKEEVVMTPQTCHPPRQSKKSGKAESKDSSSKKRSPDSQQSTLGKRAQNRHNSDSDQSPPRKKLPKGEDADSDQSPPRRKNKTKRGSDSDQSPPRRRPRGGKDSDEDLSPPRRPGQVPMMLSGGTSGLVSIDVLRKEKEENRRRDRNNLPLEDQSRNAQTVFRDKTGKRRDLDTEREEKLKKAGEKAAKDEKYAQWGRGMAQGQMYQQKLEDAMHEAHKPLARQRDDEDLDRMLRDKQREGDPMAAMLRKKKDRSSNTHDKPRYKGPPPPPNRFDLLPGYRWDGCDRSNGFEQKRYTRIADKKAVQDAAYKWSVEDM